MTHTEDAVAMLRQYAAHVESDDLASPWSEWEIEATADELEREEQARRAGPASVLITSGGYDG